MPETARPPRPAVFYHSLLQKKPIFLEFRWYSTEKEDGVGVSVILLDTSTVGNMGVGLEEVQIVPFLPLLI